MQPADFIAATYLLGITAMMTLVPLCLLPWRTEKTDWLTWFLHLVALGCCTLAMLLQLNQGWSPRLVLALWLSVVVILLLLLAVAARWRNAMALAPLLYPYLLLLVLGALLLQGDYVEPGESSGTTAWLVVHILFSLAAYGLVSLAAIAGLAVVVQELALKRRRPGPLSARLPPLADGERLQVSLLAWSEVLLAAAIASGMAHEVVTSGDLLRFDHKTLLALAAFVVIGLLLVLSKQRGLRGRQAARIVLLAYLLLTLAYPGVKFVSDVLAG